ncbi:MAG: GAF domain-containing protein, partial [Candidatus Aminicenantes bacterium]|nr:GAF domain-containing protein [Candidatus Aminicenantes bacterium]
MDFVLEPRKGTLSGILYLENNLTPGAFSGQRVEILNILSSQMAVSLDNARLYAELNSIRSYLKNIIDSMPSVLIGVPPAACPHFYHTMARASYLF